MKVYRAYGFRKKTQKKGYGMGLVRAKTKKKAEKITSKKARKFGFKYYGVAPQYPSLIRKRR